MYKEEPEFGTEPIQGDRAHLPLLTEHQDPGKLLCSINILLPTDQRYERGTRIVDCYLEMP
jgi:hypothetical protein